MVAALAAALVARRLARARPRLPTTRAGVRILTATPDRHPGRRSPGRPITSNVATDDTLAVPIQLPRRAASDGIDSPSGFIGNPHATPKCTLTEFPPELPAESQIGVVVLIGGLAGRIVVPLYNLETQPDQAGLVGFIAPLSGIPILLELIGRTDSDYGLARARRRRIFRLPLPNSIELDLWGVPQADHTTATTSSPRSTERRCEGVNAAARPGKHSTAHPRVTGNAPEVPFLQNPTTCGVPLDRERRRSSTTTATSLTPEAPWPATTGCDQLSFNPSLTAKPTTTAADTASASTSTCRVPQTQSPTTPSPSRDQDRHGDAAGGLLAQPERRRRQGRLLRVSDSAIGHPAGRQLPRVLKVGTPELDSRRAAGADPGRDLPRRAAAGRTVPAPPHRRRLRHPREARRHGRSRTRRPGSSRSSSPNLPQSPLQEFNLHFFGSERGLLATPTHCGTYPVESEFVPWNSALPNQDSTSFFTIDSGPERRALPERRRAASHPRFEAGTSNNTAGMHSPFNLRARPRRRRPERSPARRSRRRPASPRRCRASRTARRRRSTSSRRPELPGRRRAGHPGLSGRQPGRARSRAGAGAGSQPLYVAGKVYLAGPYKGAPLSLAGRRPGRLGPLRPRQRRGPGRARRRPDHRPGHGDLRPAAADPRGRSRCGPARLESTSTGPDFALNPTNCDPFAVEPTIIGDEGGDGASAPATSRSPTAPTCRTSRSSSLKLTGGLKRRGHPAIHADAHAQPGRSEHSHSVSVALPKGELLDNAHIGTICTRVAVRRTTPARRARGSAGRGETPLLDEPLRGRSTCAPPPTSCPTWSSTSRARSTSSWSARIDSVKAGLRATFRTVPDAADHAASSSTCAGGSKGLLQNSKNLCGKPKRATVRMVGQNGVAARRRSRSSRPPAARRASEGRTRRLRGQSAGCADSGQLLGAGGDLALAPRLPPSRATVYPLRRRASSSTAPTRRRAVHASRVSPASTRPGAPAISTSDRPANGGSSPSRTAPPSMGQRLHRRDRPGSSGSALGFAADRHRQRWSTTAGFYLERPRFELTAAGTPTARRPRTTASSGCDGTEDVHRDGLGPRRRPVLPGHDRRRLHAVTPTATPERTIQHAAGHGPIDQPRA